ncbi:hypothetical protein HMPREF1555_01816 [Porphyromonas gingivalis F0570]|uniref:Uncharacterized protein n=1 Tax=Porphyromonas gingivalis F0570 TaxID=1227271 RepID=A0A0E2LNE5_PORGN|nr:hypothetical protein HMPREF1555_01816 [Porphyromonas gingivalis F0570]
MRDRIRFLIPHLSRMLSIDTQVSDKNRSKALCFSDTDHTGMIKTHPSSCADNERAVPRERIP